MVSQCRRNFSAKHFQQNPHNACVENDTESLTAPLFQHINRYIVASMETDTQTHTQNDYHNLTHVRRGLTKSNYVIIIAPFMKIER